jgi:hypothetical protein
MSKHNGNVLPTRSIVGFFSLFAVMMAIAICKETGVINHELAKRGVGIIIGLMLIGAGNLLPKFRLFDAPQFDPAKALAAERFAGWVFVLAGTAYVAAWVLAPMPSVIVISSVIGLVAFALVALDVVRLMSGARASVATPPAAEATRVKRILLGTLLLTSGWGAAMFLVDYIWGDDVSQRLAVIFSIVFVFIVALGGAHRQATQPPLDN